MRRFAARAASRSRGVAWWLRIAYCAVLACGADVAQALDVVVVGLLAQLAIGAWWIDSVTSLAIVWFLVKEGREVGEAEAEEED